MNIPPALAVLLAEIRRWADDPGALIFTLRGKHGVVAIGPEDVTSRSDEQLLAFIVMRCSAAPAKSAAVNAPS